MRILSAEQHKRMAWKNGGGETIEIAVHPADAGLGDFDWRVSMAFVAADGPFSVFPGIDRTLCLLDGTGMELSIAGRGRHRLTRASAPLAFPADAPTEARLLGGPITDLNVMTRRGALGHRVRHIRIEERRAIAPGARWTLLLTLGPVALDAGDGVRRDLRDRDALVLDAGEKPVELSAALPQSAILIEIDPTPVESA